MRRRLRISSVVGLVCASFACTSVQAGQDGGCRPRSLERLRALSPEGYAIYTRVEEPGFFASWIRCDDAQFDLPTAVHESTHVVTSKTDAFPLLGGGAIRRPHQVSGFFPPYRIAAAFKPDDFVTTYLRRGRASSSTDFLFLLDELNAYTHDLATAVDLKELKTPGETVDHRDGVSAMMAFLAVYAETAKARESTTWAGLQEPEVRHAILGLWAQAERVLSSSCGIPRFGHSDKDYIRRVCEAGSRSALHQILGRAPACLSSCLATTPDADDQGDAIDETETSVLPQAVNEAHERR